MMNILEIGIKNSYSCAFSEYDNSSSSEVRRILAWGEDIASILLGIEDVSCEMFNVITNAVYNCGGIAEYLSLNIPSSREYLSYLAGGIEPEQIPLFRIDDEYDAYMRNKTIREGQILREKQAKSLPTEGWDEAMLTLWKTEYADGLELVLQARNTTAEKLLQIAKHSAAFHKKRVLSRYPDAKFDDRLGTLVEFVGMIKEITYRDLEECEEKYEDYWLKKANIDFSKPGYFSLSRMSSSSYCRD